MGATGSGSSILRCRLSIFSLKRYQVLAQRAFGLSRLRVGDFRLIDGFA
jgi:hypothetical protein